MYTRFLVNYYVKISVKPGEVSIVTGYGLDARGVRVQFVAWVRDVTLLHSLQAGFGAHLASCTVDTGSSL